LPGVAAHGERVRRYAQSVARELDVDPALHEDLEIAARFHDVGKLAMPEPVIAKPTLLTRRENEIMRRHTDVGAEILESTRTLASAAPAVRASHEWFQGGGYPHQSAGSAIPFVSRVIAVVDAYDAMTQERAYRPRLDRSDAMAEIRRCSPSQFDPVIVGAFIAVVGRL
jgi:putative nucleotidyltransferase with HDIG domain